MRTTRMISLPVALCAVTVLAGCSALGGRDDGDDASASPGASETAPLDPAALDTGDYPVEPQPEFGPTDDSNIVDYEAQRLAEYVALPYEIDPTLSRRTTMMVHTLRSARNLYGAGLSMSASEIIRNNGFLYGFVGGGENPTTSINDPQKSLMTGVLRFETPENAVAASAGAVHYMQTGEGAPEEQAAEEAEYFTPSTPESLPGRPEAEVVSKVFEESADKQEQWVYSFVPKGEYMTYSFASVPVGEKQWALDTIARSLEVQEPLTGQFVGMPTKNQRGDAPRPETLIDQDEVLIYTIPDHEDESNMGGVNMASYGPRGTAHLFDDQRGMYEALTEAGATHTGMWDTTVYRAESDAAAQELLDTFVQMDIDGGYQKTDPPQGLPDAKCFKRVEARGRVDECYVINGRYIGTAGELDDEDAVHQKISAQALILQKADQNAE